MDPFFLNHYDPDIKIWQRNLKKIKEREGKLQKELTDRCNSKGEFQYHH